jgi:hypothetical protein
MREFDGLFPPQDSIALSDDGLAKASTPGGIPR